MTAPEPDGVPPLDSLRTARVLRVDEESCEVWSEGEGEVRSAGFAPMFPTPRKERVSPGHLVAVVARPGGTDTVVWRWFDAVVLGTGSDGSIMLWEPAHGEVSARARPSYRAQAPGSRALASAGLPGAEWWVAVSADAAPHELSEVHALYTDAGLWPAVLDAAH